MVNGPLYYRNQDGKNIEIRIHNTAFNASVYLVSELIRCTITWPVWFSETRDTEYGPGRRFQEKQGQTVYKQRYRKKEEIKEREGENERGGGATVRQGTKHAPHLVRYTICKGSSTPFYIVTHYINWSNYFLDTQ